MSQIRNWNMSQNKNYKKIYFFFEIFFDFFNIFVFF